MCGVNKQAAVSLGQDFYHRTPRARESCKCMTVPLNTTAPSFVSPPTLQTRMSLGPQHDQSTNHTRAHPFSPLLACSLLPGIPAHPGSTLSVFFCGPQTAYSPRVPFSIYYFWAHQAFNSFPLCTD